MQGYSNDRVKILMKKNLRGELTEPRLKQKYSLSNNHMVMAIANYLKADDFADIKEIHATVTPVLVNSVVQSVSLQYQSHTFRVTSRSSKSSRKKALTLTASTTSVAHHCT